MAICAHAEHTLHGCSLAYALHALCTHMNWSIPDVLRIKKFSIEIGVKLTAQQFD